ncbi:MAG: sulfate reduction electron transfer complex DsrMKJOP subunit DsrM [Deltaproteobacteria bacterium]|nr:sulfate reduction electron transfer complex DsrMKJOP subunit DsrM [Deltaproteobacteria bacterium]
MNIISSFLLSFLAVIALIVIAWAGALTNLQVLFGVVIPYIAIITFVAGVVYRVLNWAQSPVPFRIPTTCGQEKSFPWIKANCIENPSSTLGVVIRMAFEVLTFRSLFRGTTVELRGGPKLDYRSTKWLWMAALGFHYSFLMIFFRHFRFFTEPIPALVHLAENMDSFFEVTVPALYISDGLLMACVTYLLIRRVIIPQVRYISLPADYFPLFLILAIGTTGILMRYILKVDVVSIKELAMGLVTFHPAVPKGIGSLFYIHLFLVCVLIIYFPFSKLVHLGGVFLSPTRNLANNNRQVRHVNPWNYPVKLHTYAQYEDHFRDKMIEAGLPVEKELSDEKE